MVEQFFETLVTELEHSCLNRESELHVTWTLKDVNLDISKCRTFCIIDNGYMWNAIKICDSCDKILHSKLDRFNRS